MIIHNQVNSKLWHPAAIKDVKISHLLFADDILLFARVDEQSIKAVNDSINSFLSCSGLNVNHSKSHIWFSPQTPHHMRHLVECTTGFSSKNNPGIYLGFPLNITNRRNDFSFILDKLRNHITLWKSKLLSYPGKVVLIKSVGMGILNYFMQCLYLPKSVCLDIDKLFRDFLWGTNPDTRKIILLSWSKICRDKCRGGLGIVKTHERNLSLCSKLAWRMLTNSTSAWAQICIHQNSLTCANSSNIGKATVAGLSILQKFETKNIFSGNNTSFWYDKWLPCGTLRSQISGPLLQHENMTSVRSALNSNGDWNLDSLSIHLPPSIKFLLLSIPKNPSSTSPDTSSWSCSNNNLFYLKLVYNSITDPDHESHPHSNCSWVWKLKCQARLKFFIWRIMNNGLPVAHNLLNRGLHISDFCPLCCSPYESIEHLFRFCSAGILMRLPFPLQNQHNLSFHNWIKSNASCKTLSQNQIPLGTLFVYSLWHLWIARNKKIFENNTFSPYISSNLALMKATEFYHLTASTTKKNTNPSYLIGWIAPPPGFVKINTDGAHNHTSNLISAGGIIRNDQGHFICCFNKFLGHGNALLAELWGISLGLNLCISRGFSNVIAETDSLLAANLIADSSLTPSHCLFPLIESCRSGLNALHINLTHVYREGNICTDSLAKRALLDMNHLAVFDVIPPYLLLAFGYDLARRKIPRRIGVG